MKSESVNVLNGKISAQFLQFQLKKNFLMELWGIFIQPGWMGWEQIEHDKNTLLTRTLQAEQILESMGI